MNRKKNLLKRLIYFKFGSNIMIYWNFKFSHTYITWNRKE